MLSIRCRRRGHLAFSSIRSPPADGRREHAVHELLGGFAAEELGQLDRFIDDRRGGRVAQHAELVQRDAQDVAVDGGHLRQRELRRERVDLLVELLLVLEHALDELPGESCGILGETGPERAPLPGLLWISAIEVDLEERLQRHAARRVTAGTDLRLPHAAGAAVVPMASTSRVATARSPTAIAQRIIFARARPCVTTLTPAMPRSGAETYGS